MNSPSAIPHFESFSSFCKRYVLQLWPWYAAGLTFLALTNIVALYIPQLAKEVVNHIENIAETNRLVRLSLIIIGLGFLQMIVRSLSRVLIFWPGRALEKDVRRDLFFRILGLRPGFFQKIGFGDIISRISNDTGDLRVFFAFGVLQLCNVSFILIFTINLMVRLNLKLTVLVLIPLALSLLAMRLGVPAMTKLSRVNQESLGKITNKITEAFLNIQAIKLLNAQTQIDQSMQREHQNIYDSNIKLLFVRVFVFPLMMLMIGLSQVLIIWQGGIEVLTGKLTIGDIMAFNVYIGFLAFPLSSIGIIVAVLQRCRTALTRLDDLSKERTETEDYLNARIHESQQAKILSSQPLLEIKNLSFAYDSHEPRKYILDHLSLSITEGEKIGIKGVIGSGKSTLLNLIVGLLPAPRNSIFYKGTDILQTDPSELRKNVFLCSQEVFLFAMSIRDNLCLGLDPKPTQKQLEEAADRAQILGEITSFPNSWDTEIGERGVRLSGGQKQRLALARAFLRKPRLLLLDDVLSAVDQTTEAAIVRAIEDMKCTMLVASHRYTVHKKCTRILELKDGKC